MGLEDVGVEVVKALLPPKSPNDEVDQQRWRWVVFSSIIVLGLILSLHIALACGWIPAVYSGFAVRSSVASIQSKIDLIAIQSIETAIRNKVIDRCKSQDTGFKQELTEDIDKLDREYFELQHTYYKEPTCESVL